MEVELIEKNEEYAIYRDGNGNTYTVDKESKVKLANGKTLTYPKD